MANYRIRFSKGLELRFLSHLDLIKAIERGLRRAQLTMAYSEGFHPHAKLGFGPALAVGIDSRDEYFDVELAREMAPEEIEARLNRALPPGLRVMAVRRIGLKNEPLNAFINRASYDVVVRVAPPELDKMVAACETVMNVAEISVERTGKKGRKVVNIRPWLHNVKVEPLDEITLRIHLIGEIGSGGNLRPDELIGTLGIPAELLRVTRTGLWHEANSQITAPLDYGQKHPEGNG